MKPTVSKGVLVLVEAESGAGGGGRLTKQPCGFVLGLSHARCP